MEKQPTNSVQVNGQRVRELRQGAYLTQRELAERVGIKVERLSRLENGRQTGMYRTTLRALAEALGVKPGELVDEGH
jgi:transcriptional regulator with XRE-family HTH domain